ncbi:Alpha/beta hydrolase [Gammaproteobacteria bacterium]
MLFITNRAINESLKLGIGRKITFDRTNNQSGQSIYFCRRNGSNDYTEIGSTNLLDELRNSQAEQILIYIHGFNNQPEEDIFSRTQTLQGLFNGNKNNLVLVLPIIWPCNDNFGIIRDYYYDEDSADASGFAFSRLLDKFIAWQNKNSEDAIPNCLKRINVLTHSMGSRVLRSTLERWGKYNRSGEVPLLFRNTFLIAADIANNALERSENGKYICQSSRNVTVYFAADDLALRASKVANSGNITNRITSRRLGHSGPQDPDLLPRNVYMVDCDEINNVYDTKGHSYFLNDEAGQPGLVFQHILKSLETGRVDVDDQVTRMKILK